MTYSRDNIRRSEFRGNRVAGADSREKNRGATIALLKSPGQNHRSKIAGAESPERNRGEESLGQITFTESPGYIRPTRFVEDASPNLNRRCRIPAEESLQQIRRDIIDGPDSPGAALPSRNRRNRCSVAEFPRVGSLDQNHRSRNAGPGLPD